jgi:hypothetical protein
MSDEAPELKPKSSERDATGQVPRGSLTAKDVLKKVFGCAGPLADDEILQRIRDRLASGSKTQFGFAEREAHNAQRRRVGGTLLG